MFAKGKNNLKFPERVYEFNVENKLKEPKYKETN